MESKPGQEEKDKRASVPVVSEDADATIVSRRWKFLSPSDEAVEDAAKVETVPSKPVPIDDKTRPLGAADPDATIVARKQPEPPIAEEDVATGQLASSGSSTAQGDASNSSLEDTHVLVVEDNVPNFVLIARLLAFMGIKSCEWKTSGWQVVEFADTLPQIDLILLDIRLPYEDGYQALKRIRNHDKLKDTLVIAVTAEASADQMKKARESGFNGFLAKPLNPDKFPEQIKRILAGEPVWEWQS